MHRSSEQSNLSITVRADVRPQFYVHTLIFLISFTFCVAGSDRFLVRGLLLNCTGRFTPNQAPAPTAMLDDEEMEDPMPFEGIEKTTVLQGNKPREMSKASDRDDMEDMLGEWRLCQAVDFALHVASVAHAAVVCWRGVTGPVPVVVGWFPHAQLPSRSGSGSGPRRSGLMWSAGAVAATPLLVGAASRLVMLLHPVALAAWIQASASLHRSIKPRATTAVSAVLFATQVVAGWLARRTSDSGKLLLPTPVAVGAFAAVTLALATAPLSAMERRMVRDAFATGTTDSSTEAPASGAAEVPPAHQ